MFAAAVGDTKMIDALIDAVADIEARGIFINAEDSYQRTAAIYAEQSNQQLAVEHLLSRGATSRVGWLAKFPAQPSASPSPAIISAAAAATEPNPYHQKFSSLFR